MNHQKSIDSPGSNDFKAIVNHLEWREQEANDKQDQLNILNMGESNLSLSQRKRKSVTFQRQDDSDETDDGPK
jgi:hypothetical protein